MLAMIAAWRSGHALIQFTGLTVRRAPHVHTQAVQFTPPKKKGLPRTCDQRRERRVACKFGR